MREKTLSCTGVGLKRDDHRDRAGAPTLEKGDYDCMPNLHLSSTNIN